ncbi:halocyanin domain-containing protein [Halosimplex aquaticum]|uniref:Halocyanin domain-containing protein n=1 Tax=Halosimplex aquaticum TaxID=3026162 RepID=A0ABD5Y705_9EURY|nr:halocyanin domain-containing protein [Halosimplex aquaticum]
MARDIRRRRLLGGIGAVVTTGLFAGCTTDTSGDGGDGGTEDGGGTAGGTVPSAVSEYLSDTSNFDGQLADHTGEDEVTVAVGAEGNGGNFAFEPAAIRIDSGTTVVWEWTGEGQSHNVVHEEGDFESETTAEESFTFEHDFGESGTYRYYCLPHKTMGMKGAVVVE